jgi:biopolymer transport protein ExbD
VDPLRHLKVRRAIASFALAATIAQMIGCGEDKNTKHVTLQINAKNEYILESSVIPADNLKQSLEAVRMQHPSLVLDIAAARTVHYQVVGHAMKSAEEAGIMRIGFISEPPQ